MYLLYKYLKANPINNNCHLVLTKSENLFSSFLNHKNLFVFFEFLSLSRLSPYLILILLILCIFENNLVNFCVL